MMRLSDSEYRQIRDIVYSNAGINLTEQKRSLIVGRLQKLVSAQGLNSFQEYCDYVQGDETGKALGEMINRISTNHTFFYREKSHFDYMSNTVLPWLDRKLEAENNKDIRVWCAASSSGEEPYLLAMLLMEYFGTRYNQWDLGVLATDISEKALNTAVRGVYPDERVTLLPPKLKNKYMKKHKDGSWEVQDKVKQAVLYRRFNLMNKQFPFKGKFHIIFCRNVMIYFDQPTRQELVRKLYNFTHPGGYLFIGHSESLGRDWCPYDYLMPAVYRKTK